MTRMTIAINELKNHNLPYIVVVTNPTSGGLSASIVSLSDICIGERGATFAFAGKRVIQNTFKGDLPENFQDVSWQKERGQVDIVLDRKDILPTISTLLSILLKKHSTIKTDESDSLIENYNQETKEAS